MSEINNGKYNIDDLVNSLLKERQPDLETTAPIVVMEEGKETPLVELADAAGEDMMEDPSQLLSFDAVEEAVPEEDELPLYEEPVEDRMPEPISAPVVEAPIAKHANDTVAMPPIIPPVAAVPPVPSATEAPKKKRRLFARKMEDTASIERSWVDWDLKPIGHYHIDNETPPAETVETVAPVVAGASSDIPPVVKKEPKKSVDVDEFPAVTAVAETITMPVVLPSGVALPRGEAQTRIIPAVSEESIVPEVKAPPVVVAPVEEEKEEQLPDQLSLEEMVRVEDIDDGESAVMVAEEDLDPEERLQRVREEKVREFTLDGDEEEANEVDEEPVDEEPEIEDFTSYEEAQTVEAELKYRYRTSLLSLIFTGLIQFALLVVTVMTVILESQLIPPVGFLVIQLFGLVLMMGLNYSTITRGLSGIFTLKANNDTAPALASMVCLMDVIAHFLNVSAPLPYWTPLVGLLLTLAAAGHHAQEACVLRNFTFVSYPGDKYAAAVIEEEGALQEIGRRAVSEGEATVAYFRRTDFLTDYLTNSYDDDCGDDWSRWLAPAALGLSLILSLVSLLSEHVVGIIGWMSVFTGMVCLSMPVTLLAVQMAMSGCCRRMLSHGGFMVGWKAVRAFGQPDALAVDVADLYPDESMLLHGIKTFSDTHIDEAILTAASLAVRSEGPLAMIFRRIIENKEDLLYDVDSLVYEQGMGLSGWVDGRRVFVGNGRLLQNHGVDVPSADYEARYAKDGRRLVYLSISGQLSAMFVVSYLPDPEIQSALKDLCRSRVTLLVRSCDPNITTLDLCQSFELDEYYVDVLPAAAGRMYMQLTEQTAEALPAMMASNGHILGTARVLSACRNLQIKAKIALAVQTALAILGLILCLLWTMQSTISLFQPLLLMLSSLILTWFIPLFKKV